MAAKHPIKKPPARGRLPPAKSPLILRLTSVETALSTADVRWLRRWSRTLAGLAGVKRADLSIAVVDVRTMRRLHSRHLGVGTRTDVLTFDLTESAEARLEGEIILCADVARRQAARLGHKARLEMLLYIVHGLLHLLGFDDHAAAQAARMHRRENELFVAAGLPPISVNPGSC